MPIVAIRPGMASQNFQVTQTSSTPCRVFFSCSKTVLFMAMSVSDMQIFMQGAPANAFVQLAIGPSENQQIDFVVPGMTPWAILIANQSDDVAAVYWQTFVRG